MKIVLASGNRNKIREIKSILEEVGCEAEILSMAEIGFASDIVEDGASFEENALIKARAVATLGYIGIGDDSGLCVDCLNGAPGIYSARYAGEPCCDERNNQKLLAEMEKVGGTREARFVCVLACALPNGRFFTVRGECEGEMLKSPKGAGGFGYDPLFKPRNFEKTFSELSFDEKNAISHRGRALRAFAEAFPVFMKNNPNNL